MVSKERQRLSGQNSDVLEDIVDLRPVQIESDVLVVDHRNDEIDEQLSLGDMEVLAALVGDQNVQDVVGKRHLVQIAEVEQDDATQLEDLGDVLQRLLMEVLLLGAVEDERFYPVLDVGEPASSVKHDAVFWGPFRHDLAQ
jgi:hypothetical protein